MRVAKPIATVAALIFGSGTAGADDWANVLAKAKQEGLVVVHGAPGKSYAKALQDDFSKAYPDIKIQFSGASGRTDVPKLLRERKANIFAWDVWVSGAYVGWTAQAARRVPAARAAAARRHHRRQELAWRLCRRLDG